MEGTGIELGVVEKLTVNCKVTRECIQCDGPGCEEWNPSLRCRQCKIFFYCSRECQKKHWKHHKQGCKGFPHDVLEERGKTFRQQLQQAWTRHNMEEEANKANELLDVSNAINTECCICLADPIEHSPVVLPDCRHAFCGPCLMQWQGRKVVGGGPGHFQNLYKYQYDGSFPVPYFLNEDQSTGCCPLCNQETNLNVYIDALTKACLYQVRATDIILTPSKEDRDSYAEKAIQELDKVLNEKVWGIGYFRFKAQLLSGLKRGNEALACLEEMKRIDRSRKLQISDLEQKLQRALTQERYQDAEEIDMELKCVGDVIPSDTYTQRVLRLDEVVAWMSLEQWEKAKLFLQSMLATRAIHEWSEAERIGQYNVKNLWKGIEARLAECHWNLGDYDWCIEMMQKSPRLPVYPGTRKWAALGKLGMSQKDYLGMPQTDPQLRREYLRFGLLEAKRTLLYEGWCLAEVYQDNLNVFNSLVDEWNEINSSGDR